MTPKLHDINFVPGRWHWHGVPQPVIDFLENPANAAAMQCVKTTQKRLVCRAGKYYLKIDFNHRLKDLFFPAAKCECHAAEKLAEAGIDTVKHLGWARSGLTTMLITEAWHEDAEDVMRYWCKNFVYAENDPAEFLDELALWMRDLVAKPLKHGDFHFGNVLYSPGHKAFTLVDLHNVTVGEERSSRTRRDILHALLDLRIAVRPGRMAELFWKVGNLDPDSAALEMHRMLLDDLKIAEEQWERRVKQFLSGYQKFSSFVRWHGQDLLVQRNLLRENIFDPIKAEQGAYSSMRLDFPAALEMMLFSFWLSLLLIPHVPVAALAEDGTLFFPKVDSTNSQEPSREAINEFNEYLLCFGLNQEDYRAWRSRPADRLIVITSCTSMLTSIKNRERFQKYANWRINGGKKA